MNVIQFHWHDLLQLWPLLFIFWGINLMPGRQSLKLIIKVIILGLALYWVFKNPHESGNWEEFDNVI